MSDITRLLRDAAPPPGALDLERAYREGRRRKRRPLVVALTMVFSVITMGSVLTVVGGDHSSAPVIAPPTTEPVADTTVPSTLPTTTPTTVVTSATIPAPGVDQLSRASRLGYAGLGPVTLGMTLTEASRAAGTPIAHHGPQQCNSQGSAYADEIWPSMVGGAPFVFFGVRDDRIVTIAIYDSAIFTISGVHVGSTEAEVLSTYPNAQVVRGMYGTRVVRITNAEGRDISFIEGVQIEEPPGTVGLIVLSLNRSVANVGFC